MEKIITPLEIPSQLIPPGPSSGNPFNQVLTRVNNPNTYPLFYHYMVSSVLRLKETHKFEYIKNQVLTNLGGIGLCSLKIDYLRNYKIQHSVNRAKFWLSFLDMDGLIKANGIECKKEDIITPQHIPLFKTFNLTEEYKTDINSGKYSAEVSLIGTTNTIIFRLNTKSDYFPIIDIQNLLNPRDNIIIKNEDDWIKLIAKPKNQFDTSEYELIDRISQYYTKVSNKKSNIELDKELLSKINSYLNNWTRIDYGKVYNHLDLKIFKCLTQILGAIEPRYALVTDDNNINLIKYD